MFSIINTYEKEDTLSLSAFYKQKGGALISSSLFVYVADNFGGIIQ